MGGPPRHFVCSPSWEEGLARVFVMRQGSARQGKAGAQGPEMQPRALNTPRTAPLPTTPSRPFPPARQVKKNWVILLKIARSLSLRCSV